MKKRILFVDDEPRILAGLRNRLRRQRKIWDMHFVESGAEALSVLEAEPCDVLVTDMRMPQMDGATLLTLVQNRHPNVVRIVLSGHAELETALRAIPVAHQFLTKPCDAGVLENVVERACGLQSLISDEVVRTAVGGIEDLPSAPLVYSRLMTALSDANVSTKTVAGILTQDMAMCAKILQMVNSAFFRLSRQITKIEDAVSYLGFNAIKQIALAVEVFQSGDAGTIGSLKALQQHSILVGNIASRMLTEKGQKEDAFVAGLLHDIGKLLLIMKLPDRAKQAAMALRECDDPMFVVEQRLWAVTHAEIGAYLLGIWGLPYPIVEAVGNHHAPERVAGEGFDILAAVHVANVLADEQMSPTFGGENGGVPQLDMTYIAKMAVEDKLAGWREMAAKQVEALTATG